MKQISISIIILFFLSSCSKKDLFLCQNELALISKTTDIAYVKLDSNINYINKTVSNILGIDSLCGRDNSIGIPFDWEEGKFIKKGGIPIEIYFENRCSNDPIEKRIEQSKLILINHKGDLLFDGTKCNSNNIIHQLNSVHYWDVIGNHYRIKTDLFSGNYSPVDTVSLVIKKLVENNLLQNHHLSKKYLKKEFCDLSKDESQQIEKENPLTISFVLNVSIPPPSLKLDTIIKSDEGMIIPTTQY